MPLPTLRALDVYLAGAHVGKLYRPGSGRLALEYDAAVADQAAGDLLLSASLPVQAERFPKWAIPSSPVRAPIWLEEVLRPHGLIEGQWALRMAAVLAQCPPYVQAPPPAPLVSEEALERGSTGV